MTLLRHFVLTFFIACLVAVVFVLLVIMAYGGRKNLDSQFAENTIFQTESKMVVYGSPIVAAMSDRPQVVLVGASNERFAWRSEELSAMLGGVPVHNLGIGGQTTRAYLETVDLILEQTPPAQRKNIVFVLGTWYGMFIPNQLVAKSKYITAVDGELLRYGIFRRKDDSTEFFAPALRRFHSQLLMACWTLMLPSSYYDRAWRGMQDAHLITELPNTVPAHLIQPHDVLNAVPPHEDTWTLEAHSLLDKYGSPDDWDDSGFLDIAAMAHHIKEGGGQFIIAELPSTTSAQETYANRRYDKLMQKVLDELKKEGLLSYIDMRPLFGRDEFFDYLHIKPTATGKAARIIATPLTAALARIAN